MVLCTFQIKSVVQKKKMDDRSKIYRDNEKLICIQPKIIYLTIYNIISMLMMEILNNLIFECIVKLQCHIIYYLIFIQHNIISIREKLEKI